MLGIVFTCICSGSIYVLWTRRKARVTPEPEQMSQVAVESASEDSGAPNVEVTPSEPIWGAGSQLATDFVPAPVFAGSRPGYVFKVGPQGLGYYAEEPEF